MNIAFPLTVGSNIGTTFTSFMASFGTGNIAGFEVAVAHLVFNVLGTLIWFPIPFMRNVPLAIAKFLGVQCARRRWIGFVYILNRYFIVPLVLIGLSLAGPAVFVGVTVPLFVIFIAWVIFEIVRRKRPAWLPLYMRVYPSAPPSPHWYCYSPFWCHAFCRERDTESPDDFEWIEITETRKSLVMLA